MILCIFFWQLNYSEEGVYQTWKIRNCWYGETSKTSVEPFWLFLFYPTVIIMGTVPSCESSWGRSPGQVITGHRAGGPFTLHGHWKLVVPRLWLLLTFSPFLLLPACQLNCSDHGHCDSFTKRCICDPFWMENFIKVQLRDGDSNCGEFSAWHCASWFGTERGSELSGWVLVFPRQMSKWELGVFSVCRGLLLPSSTLAQG